MKWRYWITSAWWTIVARLYRRAYLRHEANSDDHSKASKAIDELESLDTQKWTRRGEKVNVEVDKDIPLPKSRCDALDCDGRRALYVRPWDTRRKLRKLVEDAEYEKARRRREGRELWVKYFTAIVAALAMLASFANLYLSSRKK